MYINKLISGRRRRLAALTACGLTLVLAGSACMADGASTQDADGPVTLRMTVWTGSEKHLALLNGIAEEYTRQNPNVTAVEFQTRAAKEYNTALTAQLAGGNPPDLGWVFEASAKQFIAAGTLADIGAELRADKTYRFDDIAPSTLRLWVRGDEVYAYPFSTSPFGIFYNADMFAAAGLPTPDELRQRGEWTWTKLAEAATAIVNAKKAESGLVVRDFEYQRWDRLATVWRGFGAHAWSPDGTKCGFADPEMVEAMTFFHNLVFKAGAHPKPGTSSDFFAGEAAMTITQISRASQLEGADYAWGLVPLPAGPKSAAAVIGQAGLAVFAASPHRQAAVDFLKFMTNEQNGQKLAQFFPPPRTSLLTSDVLAQSNPLLQPEQLEAVVIDGIENGETLPSHPNAAKLADTVQAELDALWRPEADVDAVLAQVCTAIEPLLTSGR